MDLKELRALPSITARPARWRKGRGPGSGNGKTAGRGHKGAGQRSGDRQRDFYAGGALPFHERFPKRGFSNDRWAHRYAILNVADLNCFEDGTEITEELLHATGLVKQPKDGVKILGDGALERKNLSVSVHKLSKSAKEKLDAAGCKVTLIEPTHFVREAKAKAKA